MTELHIHLDGSLRPETVRELAQEQNISYEAENMAGLRILLQAPVPCGSLSEYLSRFALPVACLQEEYALERAVRELTEDLAGEGQTYGEIRFAPQLHLQKGLSQEQVIRAAVRGAEQGMKNAPSIRVGLLLCCMRGEGAENERQNMETIDLAADFRNGGVVCGVDLAGAEEVYDTGLFRNLFLRADRYGLKRTIHAGEADGPDSVRKALDMGAMRIGHGIAAAKDERLMRELADRKIPLEVCVTSNVQTKGVPSLQDHPIRRLYEAGVRVTLNTDNRTVSDTTLKKEIRLAKTAFGFTDRDAERMESWAAEAAFLQ